MSYIVQRNQRFYVVDYNGHDPITGRERRRWHPAGPDRQEAEALQHRVDSQRPATSCNLTVHGFMTTTWLATKQTLTQPTLTQCR